MSLLAEKRLCFKCLDKGHRSNRCPALITCAIQNCNAGHNTLLHGRPYKPRQQQQQRPTYASAHSAYSGPPHFNVSNPPPNFVANPSFAANPPAAPTTAPAAPTRTGMSVPDYHRWLAGRLPDVVGPEGLLTVYGMAARVDERYAGRPYAASASGAVRIDGEDVPFAPLEG